jgi:glycosyltransferase involved in cell wall biosynthesis
VKYLIFYCDVEWDIFNRREFILEMAKVNSDCKVVAINRPAALIPNIFRRGKARSVFNALFSKGCQDVEGVRLIRPFTIFHDLIGARFNNGQGNFIQRIFIDRALKYSGINPKPDDEVVIWLYEQTQWQFSNLLRYNKKTIVWEIFDDYRLTAQGNPRKLWIDCEPSMLKKSNHIFTLTESIKAKYHLKHNRIDVMGNGYPSNYFYPRVEIPCDVKNVSGPIAMYLGTVRDWIDFGLLKILVKDNSAISFVFIGPVIDNVRHLMKEMSSLPNFHYLGPKSRQEVPLYMSVASVAIIPYLANDFTASVKPIKLYEFLACGTPVVTTTSADIKTEPGALYVANQSNFSEQMNLAILDANKDRCVEMSSPWSWASVAKFVSKKLCLSPMEATHE